MTLSLSFDDENSLGLMMGKGREERGQFRKGKIQVGAIYIRSPTTLNWESGSTVGLTYIGLFFFFFLTVV